MGEPRKTGFSASTGQEVWYYESPKEQNVYFNDFPGRDEQEEAAGIEDLIEKMVKSIVLDDGTEVEVYSPTLVYSDRDADGELWTERTKKFGSVLFDYFFLTEGANDDFVAIDHIYPEEFSDIPVVSDHIPIILDLQDG